MFKRILCILLSVLMLALCGCFEIRKDDDQSAAGPTEAPTEELTPEPTAEPTPEPTEEPTPTPKPAATPKPTASPEPTEDPDDALYGTVSGGVYENEVIGLGCELTGWSYKSRSELERLSGVMGTVLPDELSYYLDNYQSMFVMYGSSADSKQNVNIVLEASDFVFGDPVYLEEMIEASVEPTRQALESMGYKDLAIELSTARFLGEEVPCMDISGVYMRQNITQKSVFIVYDGLDACITATSIDSDNNDAILQSFYRVDSMYIPVSDFVGPGDTYTGRFDPITFTVPEGWRQTFGFGSEEAAFLNEQDEYIAVCYTCMDMCELMGVVDTFRSYQKLEIYEPEEFAHYMGIDAIECGELEDCPEECFYYNLDMDGLPTVVTVMLKNGYLHLFYLMSFDDEIPERHRLAFYDMMMSAKLP